MTVLDREALRELAEDGLTPVPSGGGFSRIVEPRYVLEIGPEPDPGMNIAHRLRIGEDEVEQVLAEVRSRFQDVGRRRATWEVTGASRPSGLVERLRAHGMVPDDPPQLLALACTREPAGPATGIDVERVERDAQYDEVRAIFAEGDGWTPGDDWLHGGGQVTRYLARIDGRAVATADISWLEDERAAFLGGALTLGQYRGRGAYRALVHRRWQDAGERGRSVLVTQSEPMSQPILLRLGFEVVGEISVLVDSF